MEIMKKFLSNKIALAILVFIITFVVYILTCNPTLTFTDNGELASACVTLGIAHPTGYPLFTILGYIWSLLPISASKIYQLNLLSALWTSLASIMLFFNIRLILANLNTKTKQITQEKKRKVRVTYSIEKFNVDGYLINIIAFLSAIAFAFARTTWEQANSLEVYSLEILLMNIVIYVFLKAFFAGEKKHKYILSAFLFGLAMTNHMTSILLLPAILWMYFQNDENKFVFNAEKIKGMLILIIPLVISLSLYLYLPIRSAMQPDINWGWVHRGFDKLLYHLQGKQYQVWMFSDSTTIITNLGVYFSVLPYQFGFAGILAAIYGMFAARKSNIFWFLVLLILVDIAYATNYSIVDIGSYFLLSFIALFIFFAVGLAYLTKKNRNWLYFGLLIVIMNIAVNYKENDHSDDYLVKNYTLNMCNTLKPNAIVISSQWDFFVSSFAYMQRVEGYRKDICVVESELLRRTWYPLQFKKWYPDVYKKSEAVIEDYGKILELFESKKPYDNIAIQQKYENVMKSIIDENIDDRPIYITGEVFQKEQNAFKNYLFAPEGMAMRVLKKEKEIITDMSKINIDYFVKNKGKYSGVLPEKITLLVADNIYNIALYYSRINLKERSKQVFDMAYQLNPEHQYVPMIKFNLSK